MALRLQIVVRCALKVHAPKPGALQKMKFFLAITKPAISTHFSITEGFTVAAETPAAATAKLREKDPGRCFLVFEVCDGVDMTAADLSPIPIEPPKGPEPKPIAHGATLAPEAPAPEAPAPEAPTPEAPTPEAPAPEAPAPEAPAPEAPTPEAPAPEAPTE
jgi:hypothetical protein